MKNQTCCFTGHRDIPAADHDALGRRLEEEILALIREGVRFFGAGGALGFDTLAALCVLKLRESFPDIRLILVLPCKNQTRGWRDADIETYNLIRDRADKVVYVSEGYYSGCMQKRNRYLVDAAGVCVCYLTGNSGGTAYTVNYARKNGVRVVNLAELYREL